MATQRYLDGNTYSRMLVSKTEAMLRDRNAGLTVTLEDIAKHLTCSRQMVSAVRAGSRTFGRSHFEELAEREGLTLRQFLIEIVDWERENHSLPDGKQSVLWDRKLPNLEELRSQLMTNLRRRFLVARHDAARPELKFTAEAVLRTLLEELFAVLKNVCPEGSPEVNILFLGSTPEPGSHRSHSLVRRSSRDAKGQCVTQSQEDEDVPPNVVSAAESMWNSLDESVGECESETLSPLWIESKCEDRLDAKVVQNSDMAARFLISYPCYQNRFHLLHDSRELAVRVSLHICMLLDRNDVQLREFISEAIAIFSHMIEYVCLGTVGDVMAATYSAGHSSDSYDRTTQALISNWTRPPVERVEAAFQKWSEVLTRKRSGSNRLAKTMRRLLAFDMWVFDGWRGDFYFNPAVKLHCTTNKSENVEVTDTATGGLVSYRAFYEKHLAKLRPRPQEGKSVECIGARRYSVVKGNESDGLRAEVKVLLVGTKIGLPLIVCSNPNLAAVVWLRFECELCKSDVERVVALLWHSLAHSQKYNGFAMEPLFSKPQKPTKKSASSRDSDRVVET